MAFVEGSISSGRRVKVSGASMVGGGCASSFVCVRVGVAGFRRARDLPSTSSTRAGPNSERVDVDVYR